MFVVIHEEGNWGNEIDPYYYSIIGIFNTKDQAVECLKEDEKKNDTLKKEYDRTVKLFLHYYTWIAEIKTPFAYVKGMSLYLVIESEQRGENIKSVVGVYQTEEEAKLSITEDKKDSYFIFSYPAT